MSRSTQHVLLLLLGFATAVMVAKGTYLNYVKPGLLPWLVVAAAVLVVLGASGVVGDLRHVAERRHDPDEGHEHGHSHRTGLAWLLLVPIAMLAFVVPPPLDARGTTPTAVATTEPEMRPFPPLPPGPAPEVSVPETVMRAAADSGHSLDDRTITLTGFVVSRPGGADLGRVVIVCCAADAQLARVHLAGALADGYPEDTWLRVRGRIRPGSAHADDGFVPTLEVSDVVRVDKPKNAYAY